MAGKKSVAGQEGAENGAGGYKPRKKSARGPVEKKEEEVPAFAGMKLKKSTRVQRKWDDDKMETVQLKHHDFEKEPLDEMVKDTYHMILVH